MSYNIIYRALRYFLLWIVSASIASATGSENGQSAEHPWSDGKVFDTASIVAAYMKAYPGRIKSAEFRDGDWALLVDDEWFYWAGGRLLPSHLRLSFLNYDPHPFYSYLPGYRAQKSLTPEQSTLLEEYVRERDRNPTSRHPGFFDAIWRARNEDEAWDRVKVTYFLGKRVEVHREILEDLAAVEEDILELSKTDSALYNFVKSLNGIQGYNWRDIAGTESRSFHAYGTAIDLSPRRLDRAGAYWLWARAASLRWYELPLERMFLPPLSFIHAFERHGFVWGGKWLFYDSIHFEYRPEILIINGML